MPYRRFQNVILFSLSFSAMGNAFMGRLITTSQETAPRWHVRTYILGSKRYCEQLLGILQVHTFIFCLSTIVHFNSTIHEHEGLHLATCPDCILWTDTSVTKSPDGDSRKGRNLYLFSKFTGFFTARHEVKTPKFIHVVILPIQLVLQQGPAHWKTLIWRLLRNRQHVSTSHLISTLESPQVRSCDLLPLHHSRHMMHTICVTQFPYLSCRPVPWSRRHKGGRAIKGTPDITSNLFSKILLWIIVDFIDMRTPLCVMNNVFFYVGQERFFDIDSQHTTCRFQ